jgi:Ca2+-binding RTX toxin-like protein
VLPAAAGTAPAAAGLVVRGGAVMRAGADGTLAGWTLPGGAPADPGLPGAARTVVINHAGGNYRIPGPVAALLAAAPGQDIGLGGAAGFVAGRVQVAAVATAEGPLIVAGCGAGGGIAAYALQGGGTARLAGLDRMAAPAGAGAPVAALATVTLGGQPIVLAATGAAIGAATGAAIGGPQAALTTWRLGADGTLTALARLGAAEGIGIAAPAALATVRVAGTDYAVMAAAGTSSLTVFRLGADGSLTATDHRIDTLDTRFEGAAALAAVTVAGRGFVFAAGRDGGISAFAVLPDGRLLHLGALVQDWGTGPARITHLAALRDGGTIRLAAAIEGEAALRMASMPLGDLGPVLRAPRSGGTVTGGAAGDLLFGSGAADVLRGGAGADILIDGAGADTLSGGAGADVFVLVADGAPDRIEDFERGVDRLDLSAWPMLRSAAQLDIRPTATGAEIRFGAERLTILAADRQPLTRADFPDAAVLPLIRPAGLPEPRPPPADPVIRGTGRADQLAGGAGRDTILGRAGDDTLSGGDGRDVLRGGPGHDLLSGGAGNDRLFGGPGNDTLEGGAGADRLRGGPGLDWASYREAAAGVAASLAAPATNTGEAAGDSYRGIENLAGSRFADRLEGNRFANRIEGGAGNDTLLGGAGNDTLVGGAGDDVLIGGRGADTFVFAPGDGRDRIADFTPGLDVLRLAPGTEWEMRTSSGQVLVWIDKRTWVLFEGVTPADLAPGDIDWF